MIFIETTVFTRQLRSSLDDAEYRALQLYLALHPDAGDVIPGSGELRKIRWGISSRGKRGGVRVIYFWRSVADELYLLLYPKNEQTNLSPAELRQLRRLILNS